MNVEQLENSMMKAQNVQIQKNMQPLGPSTARAKSTESRGQELPKPEPEALMKAFMQNKGMLRKSNCSIIYNKEQDGPVPERKSVSPVPVRKSEAAQS